MKNYELAKMLLGYPEQIASVNVEEGVSVPVLGTSLGRISIGDVCALKTKEVERFRGCEVLKKEGHWYLTRTKFCGKDRYRVCHEGHAETIIDTHNRASAERSFRILSS